MKTIFLFALMTVVGVLTGCTTNESSSDAGTPTFTTPTTLDMQSRLESTHRDRTQIY